MTTEWPQNWEQLMDGSECSMCRHGIRAESDKYGIRFYAGRFADGYLQRADVQRGYSLVIWHGRHVCEPVDLTAEEASGYWLDVLNAARVLMEYFKPLKMNYETLGNGTPHLHTHLVPRYWVDPAPGQPFPLVADTSPDQLADQEQVSADAAELRSLAANIL
jgi:diadenosine tetraphosphate (Ap4A) HIT family hydrolase